MRIPVFLKNKHIQLLLICIVIFLVNFGLRVVFISYPDQVVFDEAHFAQYSAAYGAREAHIDIHPPLGKMIFGLPLFFEPLGSFKDAKFVEYNFSNTTDTVSQTPRTEYGFFPYKTLRTTSSLIGALLICVIFLLVFFGTGKITPALLAAFFLTFENALLLETRLVLIDGSLLLFGFLGLLFLFQKKKMPILAGIFIGLALAVKLTGIIFVLTALFYFLKKDVDKKRDLKNFLKFIISVGIIFLIISAALENIWVTPAAHQNLFKETITPAFVKGIKEIPESTIGGTLAGYIPKPAQSFLSTWVIQTFFSVESYTVTGSGPKAILSPWYVWPFMGGVFSYFSSPAPNPELILIGNPFVWGIGATGILIALLRIFKKRIKKWRENPGMGDFINTLTFLCIAYLAIFAFFIHRGTFLYHYFPVFIASVCIFSVFLSKFLEEKSTRAQFWWYFLIGIITIINFLVISPLTYGF